MKLKLTKIQRHTAYILMLNESEYLLDVVKNGWNRPRVAIEGGGLIGGLCDILLSITANKEDDILSSFGLKELIKKKPADAQTYWFTTAYEEGWQQRIDLLKQCIAETY